MTDFSELQFRGKVLWAALLCGLIVVPAVGKDVPPAVANAAAEAKAESEMKPYAETIPNTEIKFEMVPILGGKFQMGSPASEQGRGEDEGPQHEVEIAPFWMGKCEVTWDEYEQWMTSMEIDRRAAAGAAKTPRDELADAVTRPTGAYTDMSFGMGKWGFPALSMTQFAAFTYTQWLTERTGRYYRLPTEAEWEYACRAGTTTKYSFGDDESTLDEYAWFQKNSATKEEPDGQYHKVGLKKANPWGLHDMHGNVAEWTLDFYLADAYAKGGSPCQNPLAHGKTEYPRIVRGGGWDLEPTGLRSAARLPSEELWKDTDPNQPKSRWYLTDARNIGFRVVRPLARPSDEERKQKWEADIDVAPKGAKEQ
jgi:formylglycine-generating enzyme required for sulfatase activity